MNLLRTLSRLHRQILEGIAAGEQRYVPALGYECLCDGKKLGEVLRPGEKHYAPARTIKALRTLRQRGLLAPDKEGILVLAGAAVGVFSKERPTLPERTTSNGCR